MSLNKSSWEMLLELVWQLNRVGTRASLGLSGGSLRGLLYGLLPLLSLKGTVLVLGTEKGGRERDRRSASSGPKSRSFPQSPPSNTHISVTATG